MRCIRFIVLFLFSTSVVAELLTVTSLAGAPKKPNIILLFADDISARELPLYGSNVWSPPAGGNTSDPKYRASTPVLDELAREGCWVKTAWAAVVCSPSRAMMMTGRYAHRHKWWENADYGMAEDQSGNLHPWPLYESSPHLIETVATDGGYATYWAGKTQMKDADLTKFGFDEGIFTPGEKAAAEGEANYFRLETKKGADGRILVNADTGEPADTYPQSSWYWWPHVSIMNDPSAPGQIVSWPNTPESKQQFGLHTYGPDVEIDFIFNFIERQSDDDKPFFIYHTTHLGHDAFNWLDPESKDKWPGTPIIHWDGERYVRTEPKVTGDDGVYDTHGTITEPGIHHHINYLDYQVWLYQNKLQELGLEDNTVFIFCADNGTSGYGKGSARKQEGTHVPLIIHAPGLAKQGRQDVLVNISDMLPTIAELAGVSLPTGYEIDGKSLVKFLFGDEQTHRDWIYAYKSEKQIIRGHLVMRDGYGKWWDVSREPDDLTSYPQIKDWADVSSEHNAERELLESVLPNFDLYETAHDAPGVVVPTLEKGKASKPAKNRRNNNRKADLDDQ